MIRAAFLDAPSISVNDPPWAAHWQVYQRDGYVVFERLIDGGQVDVLRAALTPYLEGGKTGRNDFEGYRTNRVYALLAKSPVFAELATHPMALAFAEAELGSTCLLSNCLAINLHPGETPQAWHFDDASIRVARPRPAFGVSTFWALDDTTEANGATEVIPGSHLWGDEPVNGSAQAGDFVKGARTPTSSAEDPGARTDAVKLAMPSGSLAIAKGTLWHRGGANRSDRSRLIITAQYCVGWARQIETMTLAVPPATAASLSQRAQELLGYSIHPPFMGYVDGMHPRRVLSTRNGDPRRQGPPT